MHRNPLMGLLLAGSLALTLLACKKPDAAAEKSDSPISSLSIGAEDILEIGSSEHGTGPVITGSLQPERRADLRAEVASIVIKMHKENGEPVRQGDLFGMDRPFAHHAKGGRAAGLGAKALVIGKVTKRTVDGQNAVGAAGGNDGCLGPMPRVCPMARPCLQHIVIFLRAADAGGLHAHAGGKIGSAKAHRRQAGRGCGDRLDMADPCS